MATKASLRPQPTPARAPGQPSSLRLRNSITQIASGIKRKLSAFAESSQVAKAIHRGSRTGEPSNPPTIPLLADINSLDKRTKAALQEAFDLVSSAKVNSNVELACMYGVTMRTFNRVFRKGFELVSQHTSRSVGELVSEVMHARRANQDEANAEKESQADKSETEKKPTQTSTKRRGLALPPKVPAPQAITKPRGLALPPKSAASKQETDQTIQGGPAPEPTAGYCFYDGSECEHDECFMRMADNLATFDISRPSSRGHDSAHVSASPEQSDAITKATPAVARPSLAHGQPAADAEKFANDLRAALTKFLASRPTRARVEENAGAPPAGSKNLNKHQRGELHYATVLVDYAKTVSHVELITALRGSKEERHKKLDDAVKLVSKRTGEATDDILASIPECDGSCRVVDKSATDDKVEMPMLPPTCVWETGECMNDHCIEIRADRIDKMWAAWRKARGLPTSVPGDDADLPDSAFDAAIPASSGNESVSSEDLSGSKLSLTAPTLGDEVEEITKEQFLELAVPARKSRSLSQARLLSALDAFSAADAQEQEMVPQLEQWVDLDSLPEHWPMSSQEDLDAIDAIVAEIWREDMRIQMSIEHVLNW